MTPKTQPDPTGPKNWNEAWTIAEQKIAALDAAEAKLLAGSAVNDQNAAASDNDNNGSTEDTTNAAKASPQSSQSPSVEPAEQAADSSDDQTHQPASEESQPATAQHEREEKRQQLHALATELGMTVDERRVMVEERKGFRAEKRRMQEVYQQRVAALAEREKKAEAAIGAAELLAKGDDVGAWRKLGGDDNRLNEAIAAQASPETARQVRLERELEQMKHAATQREQQEAQRAAHQEYQQVCQKHRVDIATAFRQSTQPLLTKGADNPAFVEQVRATLEHAEREGEELSYIEAAERVLPHMQAAYQGLHQMFHGAPPPKPAEKGVQPNGSQSPTTSVQPGASAPKSIAHRSSSEVSTPQRKPLTSAEWSRKWGAKLQESTPENV